MKTMFRLAQSGSDHMPAQHRNTPLYSLPKPPGACGTEGTMTTADLNFEGRYWNIPGWLE